MRKQYEGRTIHENGFDTSSKKKPAIALFVVLVIIIVYISLFQADVGLNFQSQPEVDNSVPVVDNSQEAQQDDNEAFQEAIGSDNVGACDGIDHPVKKKNCEILVLSDMAIDNDDISVCNNMPDYTRECSDKYYNNKASKTGDPSFCLQSTDRDQCYFGVALSKSDAIFCNQIERESIKNNCISIVG